MWTMVVTLFVSMLGICANFLGWLGLRASNAPLVSMFSSGVVFMQVTYLALGICSFVYAADNSNAVAIRLQSFNIFIGLVCLFMSALSAVPLTLGFTMVSRIRKGGQSLSLKHLETQMSSILKLTNGISLMASFAMMILGAVGLDVLLDEYVFCACCLPFSSIHLLPPACILRHDMTRV
jgi:hypothetical protein